MARSTKTMVYTPEVMVLINTKNGILNVTDDLIAGRVTRRIDAASDFSITLNNRSFNGSNQGKYTGKIGRMDRVVIFLKRIHWVQVFAGYTSVVPVSDLYPTTCTITGACTIKRLQNFYWNPYMTASREVMYQTGSMAITPNQIDSGIGNMLSNVICKVGNWKPETVHIQNMPMQFLDFAKTVQIVNETPKEQQEKYLNKVAELLGVTLGGIAGASGTPGVAGTGGSVAAGGEGVTFTPAQLVAQASLAGVPADQLALAAAIAMAESSGRPSAKGGPNGNGSYDYGLWQINDIHKGSAFVPGGDMTKMFDPGLNAKAMFSISGGGVNWKPWSTFNNGAYLKFMTQTKQAVATFDPNKALPGAPTTGPNVNTTTGIPVTDAANASAKEATGGYVIGTVQAIINAGKSQIGIPYSWGGGGKNGPSFGIDSGANTNGYDCSGLMQYMVWQGTGKKIDIGGDTWDQYSDNLNGHGFKVDQSAISAGDLIYTGNGTKTSHVMMYIGNNQVIEAQMTGVPVKVSTARYKGLMGIFRLKGVTNTGEVINVGTDAGAAAGDAAAGQTVNNTTGLGSSEPIGEALFRIQFMGDADASKNVLYDDLSYVNTQPLFATIKALSSAAMRSFMSAPNGDFVAFYPDPFGIMGKKPAIQIEDVELINFAISHNDSELTTHVFAAMSADRYTSTVDDTAWLSLYKSAVSMQDRAMMKSLLNVSDTSPELSPESFFAKFGVRPLAVKHGDIKDYTLNYFQALYTFLQKWSDQFNSRVELTFMPELYPGMRMEIVSQGVTVYVKEVSHDFSFDSGFSTSAIVNSPTTKTGGIPGMVLG